MRKTYNKKEPPGRNRGLEEEEEEALCMVIRTTPNRVSLLFRLVCLVGLLTLAGIVWADAPSADTPLAEAASADKSKVREHWYLVEVDGTPAGWTMTRDTRDDGRIVTETETELRLRRGPAEQKLAMSTRIVEDDDGQPLAVWSRQLLGELPMETHYDLSGEDVVVTRRQGDSETESRRPHPDEAWLTPAVAEAEVRRRLAAGDETFTLRIVDPVLGLEPLDVEWVLQDRDIEIEVDGKTYLTSHWRQAASLAPQMASYVHLAPDGLMVRSRVPMSGMSLTMTLSSRTEARASRGAPELMMATFIHPDRPIRTPRSVRRGVYELRSEDGSPLPALPSTNSQTIEIDGDRARIVVDVNGIEDTNEETPAPDPDAFLHSSVFVDHEDPSVRALWREALADVGEDRVARAETLRTFVGRHLEDKNLELLMATASEVADGGAGDCTEHSVLLAALLRADGIPSRLAAGLIYVDRFAGATDVFGYHMWTQALIGDRWVDLDASMPGSFDATHIALATTALDDTHSTVFDLSDVTPLIGNAAIRIVDIETEAETADGTVADRDE